MSVPGGLLLYSQISIRGEWDGGGGLTLKQMSDIVAEYSLKF